MRFTLIALMIFMTSPAFASSENCPNLHMDGLWKSDDTQAFFGKPKTYRISQTGCYVLVLDIARQATWKLDLSGAHKIHVPPETVQANLEGDGSAAARNLKNLEIAVTPTRAQENPNQSYYSAMLTAEADLAATKSFPVSFKARYKANAWIIDNSGCPSCSNMPVNHLAIEMHEIEILDISKGLPSGFDKPSFIAGANKVLNLIVSALRWRTPIVRLTKDQ